MLKGAQEQFSFRMMRYILFNVSKRYRFFEKAIQSYPHLKVIRLSSFKEIDAFVEQL